MLVCGKMKSFRGVCRTINKDFYDGVVDTAPLVGFLLMIPIFNKSAEFCVPYLTRCWAASSEQHPRNQHLLCGAGTPWLVPRSVHPVRLRCGYAGHFERYRLLDTVPLRADGDFLYHDERVHLHDPKLDCWGVSYAKVSTREHLKKTLPYAWMTCAIMQVITLSCSAEEEWKNE